MTNVEDADFALFFIDDFGRFSKQNKKELDNLNFIFILFTVALPIKPKKLEAVLCADSSF